MRLARLLSVLPVLAVVGLGLAPAAARARPPFYAIGKTTIRVPRSVQPWQPAWAPDGRHVIFENQADGAIWATRPSTGRSRCLTCGFRDAPHILGGFHDVLPGERRLFLTHQLGGSGGVDSGPNSDAWVLECHPSLYTCRSHRYVPIDMSGDKVGNPVIVQRRTWHLAPDGVHIGWMEVRLGATLMIVGRLHRERGRYVVEDQRVVNPPGPPSLASTDPTGWSNAGQLYELKSFADGGRAILAVAEPQTNPDVIKINLASGHVTQLTGNLAWDEDGGISPDGSLYAVHSARLRPGVQALGWVPQLEPFFAYPLAATIAVNGATWEGFQCSISPWLLGAGGDAGGRLVGQPLETYGGNLTAGDELVGQQMWNPASNAVLLQETTRQRPPSGANAQESLIGLTPHRLAIARLPRRATKPRRAVSSRVGAWAPAPQDYHATINSDRDVVLRGHGGGTAALAFAGNLAAGSWTVVYRHFSQDGRTFLDGQETVSGSPTSVLDVNAAITVSGAHTGRITAALAFDNASASHSMHGTYRATYDGHTAPPLAKPAPCYSKLPHTTPLHLRVHRSGGRLAVRVLASIGGDTRPVSGARVRAGGARTTTRSSGRVVLRPHATHGRVRLTVNAGSTFKPARRTLPWPKRALPAHELRPPAVVSMGDSMISGVAGRWQGNALSDTGDRDGTDRACQGSLGHLACRRDDSSSIYLDGTARDGCLRSDSAEIRSAAIPHAQPINIACGGAVVANLLTSAQGGKSERGEAPQGDLLRAAARTHNVKLIVVNVGVNDFDYAPAVVACAESYAFRRGPCHTGLESKTAAGTASMTADLERAVASIRSVMRGQGYAATSYRLILQTYPAPLARGSDLRYPEGDVADRSNAGCPFYDDDATWLHDHIGPAMAAAIERAAIHAKVEYLDVEGLLRGHEICSRADHLVGRSGPSARTSEWARFFSVNHATAQGIPSGQSGVPAESNTNNALGEMYHTNYFGQRSLGRCLHALAASTPGGHACTSHAASTATRLTTAAFVSMRLAREQCRRRGRVVLRIRWRAGHRPTHVVAYVNGRRTAGARGRHVARLAVRVPTHRRFTLRAVASSASYVPATRRWTRMRCD